MRGQAKAAAVAKAKGKGKTGGVVAKQQQSRGVSAAPPRRGTAGSSNGRKRGGGGSAVAAAAAAAPSVAMYDSDDSYEHHVIDLRDDQYRGANASDEDGRTTKDAQNIEEVSVENGNGREESGSDMDAIYQNGNGHLSNGKPEKHRKGAKGDDTAEEGANGGPLRPSKHHFVPGQLTWAKYARFPWWPALVMDQKGPLEGKGGSPASDTDVLVRFFGTYDYGWVDPFVNLSDFEVKLAERSRLRKKALQKGVEEALEFQASGKLPDQWEPVHKNQNGVKESPEALEVSPAADDEPKERKTARKRKPKVLFEEEGRVERKPQRMLRRLRVMRQLGLVAPAGSPFTTDYD